MLIYLVKNNFKLMLRNKWTMFLMLFGPALVVAALMNAFDGLMNTDYELEPYTVGICVAEDSPYKASQDVLTGIFDTVFKSQNGTLIIYDNLDDAAAREIVAGGKATDFIYITDTYKVFQSDENLISGHAVAYSAYMVMKKFAASQTPAAADATNDFVLEKSFEGMKLPSAADYYGIIEISYFLCCGMLCLSSVLLGEKKHNLNRKYIISPVSNIKLFLGKWIPSVLIVAMTMFISILLTVFLFDIKWGNIPGSAGILLLSITASAAFGILVYQAVSNVAIALIIQMGLVWVAGFIGGCFETYMFSSTPEIVKRMSPLYYTNRTLIEYAIDGTSSYTADSIIFLGATTLICSFAAVLLMKKKMEVK